jgi:hypothetical protein
VLNTQFNELEQRITTALEEMAGLGQSQGWETNEWTRRVKSGLGKIACERGCKWYASDAERADGGEWLLDGVAMRYDDQQHLHIPFVLESEWDANLEEVDRDFQKLVAIKSELRVMVLYARSQVAAEERIKHLWGWVEEFDGSRPGDRYLFCCWLGSTRKFFFQSRDA